MGADAAATVRDIEETRRRIDSELDALEASLPPRDEVMRKLTYAALGGAVAILSLWFLGHRMKVRRQERRVRRIIREAITESEPIESQGA
jgi:hypothetical protein